MNTDYHVKAALPGQEGLFYSDSSQEEKCIGHLRGDFGHDGDEFWTSWWPHAVEQRKTDGFRQELNELVSFLRRDLLKNRREMARYLQTHPGLVLACSDNGTMGYTVSKSSYLFCIRCMPAPGNYDFYIYAYMTGGDAVSKQIRVTYVSVWDNGMAIPTAALFDEETGIVSDIEQANLSESILESLDILTDQYVLVREKKYELQENGDGTFTVLRNYGVFFSRSGYAEIKAVSADEAMRIADETLKVDDVSWDEDWHPTNAQLEE